MSKTNINAVLAKFSVGDGLRDGELDLLLEKFTQLEADLGALSRHFNPGFGLAHKAVMKEMQTLESFKHARERDD